MNNALCTKITEQFLPFGFENLIPESLKDLCGELQVITKECETESDQDELCKENEETSVQIEEFPEFIDNVRVPNIILLGKTGAGKSFFGSGLFGAENPDLGVFKTSNSAHSCTK